MGEQSFNPRKIFWFSALAVLVVGIFILKASVILDLLGNKVILSMAHIGAISSGIFSLLSFGYYHLRKQKMNSLVTALHVLLTFGLLLTVFYCVFQIDLLDAEFPQLNASKEDIAAFHESSAEWGQYSKLAGQAFIGFVTVQIVFFISLIFRKK